MRVAFNVRLGHFEETIRVRQIYCIGSSEPMKANCPRKIEIIMAYVYIHVLDVCGVSIPRCRKQV